MKGDKAPAQPAPSVEEVMRLAFQYAQYLAGEMHQAEDKAKAALRSAVEALARGAK